MTNTATLNTSNKNSLKYERQRERQRQRDRETETETQTDRDTDRQTELQQILHTHTQLAWGKQVWGTMGKSIQTDRQDKIWQRNRQTDAGKQSWRGLPVCTTMGRDIQKQTDRQTDRKKNWQRNRQRNGGRQS